jgi:hypothetical protein
VAQLEVCANEGAARMTGTDYHVIVLDADVTESGGVERVRVRDSGIGDAGIESCIVRALEAMQVPGYIVQRMMASQPVSPASRGAVGNILVVGAAVELVPILIAAAGATFIVAVSLHVGEEVAEAIKRRRKAQKECERLRDQCFDNPFQPEWNRDRFGKEKDCKSCFWECERHNEWPDYKCPRPGYRPN